MSKFFKKKFNTKSYTFKYISILLIVLLLPSVFGLLISELSVRATIAETKERNFTSLTNIQSTIDANISESKQLAILISRNEDLEEYSYAPAGTYTGYEINKANFFPKTTPVREYVRDVFFYDKKNDVIITNEQAIYTIDQYCNYVMHVDEAEREKFINILNTLSYSNLYPAIETKRYSHMGRVPTMMLTQSYPFLKEFEGNVVIMIDIEKMIEPFAEKFENDDTALFMVNESGEIMLRTGRENFITTEGLDLQEGYYSTKIDGEKVTYCVKDSIEEKAKFVYIESDRSIYSGVMPIRLAILLYVLIILAIGPMIIVWLGKKNTQPVKELSNTLEFVGEKKGARDEFQHIQSAIRNMLSEKARMGPILEESKSTLRKMLISDILQGNFMSAEQIDDACKKVDISFLYKDFCVIYFGLDEIIPEDIPIIKYAISNIVSEVFAPIGEIFTCDSNLHSMAGIINPKMITEELEDKIISQLNFIRAFFEDNFNAVINIGVGTVLEGPDQISTSYSQAKEAAEYCALTGAKSILPYQSIKTADYRYAYPLEVEDKLLSAVISGNIGTVKQLIDQIVSANASLSLDMSRCLFFDLTATALKIMSNKAINITAVFGKQDSPFEKLMECKNITELTETIDDIFEKICNQITENHAAKKEKLKIAITDYVKLNYNNPNMSLGFIADEFGMNYTYMSHFFKDFIGANFIDYISELRVKKAQELLRTTNMPVNEIATAVGYANATVLIKIFKKVTNTTPGTYRKSAKSLV